VLDVTSFSSHHPGGGVLLRNKHLQDIKEEMKFHHPLTLVMANTMAIGSFRKEIQRLVDLDKPLSPQIWNADQAAYMKLINSPHWLFVESPRLFEANWL
jgi:cytochrome b involved in lipid metabolism